MQLLEIRPEQYRVFQDEAHRTFVQRLVIHLRKELPTHWGGLSESDAKTRAEETLNRARKLSFEDEDEVMRFAEVLTLFGPDFGESPSHVRAIKMLRSPSLIAKWPSNREMIVATKELS